MKKKPKPKQKQARKERAPKKQAQPPQPVERTEEGLVDLPSRVY